MCDMCNQVCAACGNAPAVGAIRMSRGTVYFCLRHSIAAQQMDQDQMRLSTSEHS